MTVEPIRTLDHAAVRRSELDRLTPREAWPAMTDAAPQRSALIGVLRDAGVDERRVDVRALGALRGYDAICRAADELGLPVAQLQLAILQDAGAVTVVRGAGGTDVEALVAGMPSLTERDRELVLRDLRADEDDGD